MEEEIDWEILFKEKDEKLKQEINSGKIKVNVKERYICDGCE